MLSPSRAQQGNPLSIVRFCLTTVPLQRNLRQRRKNATPTVSHVDEIQLALETITPTAMGYIDAVSGDLARTNIQLSAGNPLGLTPHGH